MKSIFLDITRLSKIPSFVASRISNSYCPRTPIVKFRNIWSYEYFEFHDFPRNGKCPRLWISNTVQIWTV